MATFALGQWFADRSSTKQGDRDAEIRAADREHEKELARIQEKALADREAAQRADEDASREQEALDSAYTGALAAIAGLKADLSRSAQQGSQVDPPDPEVLREFITALGRVAVVHVDNVEADEIATDVGKYIQDWPAEPIAATIGKAETLNTRLSQLAIDLGMARQNARRPLN